MNRTPFLLLLVLVPVVSCAPDYDDVPTKLVGIGYDPNEIGPAPTPYGGIVEYSWVNFAGGGLSLALMGLGSFDEVGPDMIGFNPPYAAVYGFSYVFDTRLSAADSLGGVTSVPPEVEDTCYTTFEATGPIGSFKTVDVGSWMRLMTEDGTGGIEIDRLPADHPPNPQDLFIYYSTIDFWAAEPIYGLVANGENRAGQLDRTLLRTNNFPFEEEVEFSFPGGWASEEEPVASLPRPSSAYKDGNTRFSLPSRPGGVRLSWTGPRYGSYGEELGGGPNSTCLAYPRNDDLAPASAADCDGADTPPLTGLEGQVYTGPWDADDGQVVFQWTPGTTGQDYVSLAVRFLGPVDRADPNFAERSVQVPSTDEIDQAWRQARRDGLVPEDSEAPTGTRPPTPCEEDGAWVFDDAYTDAEGGLAPHMRGDPFHNMAEVTCRLADDGEFVLTRELLDEALTYAGRGNAEGAVFYFARSTDTAAEVPAAKDQYNQRLDISPIKLTSRAIDIGRFWFEEGGQ